MLLNSPAMVRTSSARRDRGRAIQNGRVQRAARSLSGPPTAARAHGEVCLAAARPFLGVRTLAKFRVVRAAPDDVGAKLANLELDGASTARLSTAMRTLPTPGTLPPLPPDGEALRAAM